MNWLESDVFLAVFFFLLGAFVGNALFRWTIRLTPSLEAELEGRKNSGPAPSEWWACVPIFGWVATAGKLQYRGEPVKRQSLLFELGTGVLFVLFAYAVLRLGCQHVDEVRPHRFWYYGRVFYHLILISLLIAATGTDVRDYVIPDRITVAGVLIGVLGAGFSGDLQMIHIWIDWNNSLVEIHGPYLPDWIKYSQHLHGIAWSAAGLMTAAGITWLVRIVGSLVLRQEALGFGDVTLMAMIGSYIGWQPAIFVFLFAPLCGIVVALCVHLLVGKTYLPFGPYLSLATLVVLFTWQWLWLLTRHLFGDPQGLLILASIALAAFVLLLVFVRLYRAIPINRRISEDGPGSDANPG